MASRQQQAHSSYGVFFLMLVISLTAGTAWAAEKVVLKPTYSPGTFTRVERAEYTSDDEGGGETHHGAYTVLRAIEFQANPVAEDGTQTLQARYRRVRSEADYAGKKMIYDSDNRPREDDRDLDEEQKARCSFCRGLMAATLEITLDSDGKSVRVTGLEKLRRQMASQGSVPKRVFEEMNQEYGEGFLKQEFSQRVALLPADPVTVGETWTRETLMPMFSDYFVTMKSTLTLEAVRKSDDGRLAVLAFDGQCRRPGPVSDPHCNEMAFKDILCRQSGRLLFNVNKGMVQGREMAFRYSLALVYGSGGDAMTWTMMAKGTSRIAFFSGPYKPEYAKVVEKELLSDDDPEPQTQPAKND